MRKILYIIVTVSMLMLSSCINADDIAFNDLQSFTPKGIGSENMAAHLVVNMSNDGRAVKLKRAEIVAYLDGAVIARCWVDDVVKLKRGEHDVLFPLKVKLQNKGGVLGLLSIYKRVDDLLFDINIKGGTSFINKKIGYTQITLNQLERVIGYDLRSFIK